MPLRELKAQVFPQMLEKLLGIPADVNVILERYSDSAGSYVRLDCDNTAIYKQLYRAAKAKSKLRIKVTTLTSQNTSAPAPVLSEPTVPMESTNYIRHSYLETVLGPLAPPSLLSLIRFKFLIPPVKRSCLSVKLAIAPSRWTKKSISSGYLSLLVQRDVLH
ncbi:hypothetical protein PDIDSM_382 [Penicillium digitatum]|nr:hypothetical protein PDIDSM_382 [Penicillium digitatum]